MTSIRFEPNGETLALDLKIWRYMDLLGAIDLTSNLRMRLTSLSLFEDGWEGRRSQAEIDEEISARIQAGIPTIGEKEFDAIFTEYIRTSTYAGCWTTKPPASMLMWSLYTSSPQSLALETNIGHLMSSAGTGDPEVLIGKVNYGDRINGVINANNPFYASWSKWDHYEHEEEIRLTSDVRQLMAPESNSQITNDRKYAYISFDYQPILLIHTHPKMTDVDFENTLKIFALHGVQVVRSTISLNPHL